MQSCQKFFIGPVDRPSEEKKLGCPEGCLIHKGNKRSWRQYPVRFGNADCSSAKPFRCAAKSVASHVLRVRQNRVDSRVIPPRPSHVFYVSSIKLASDGVYGESLVDKHPVYFANAFHFQ